MEDAKTKADDTPPICNTTDAGQDEELRQGFAPQPAASDVPHDVVRAKRAVQALGALLSDKPHSCDRDLSDVYFEWVQKVEKVHADIRDALDRAAPQPAASDVPHDVVRGRPLVNQLTGALRFILAFYEPGQRHLDTEAWKAAEAGGRAALARGEAALATPAPSTSTEEALRAENARLRAALEVISNRPIPDQPATAAGDELSWAQRQYAQLRSIALSALSR